MTDNTTVPESVPGPRPDSDKIAQREAAMQAWAQRPAPQAPPGAAVVLTDQVLLHTSWDTAKDLLPGLPGTVGGLVLRGAKVATGIRELRDRGFSRPIVVDPEGYTRAVATEDAGVALGIDHDRPGEP